jgi:hypothetical protein
MRRCRVLPESLLPKQTRLHPAKAVSRLNRFVGYARFLNDRKDLLRSDRSIMSDEHLESGRGIDSMSLKRSLTFELNRIESFVELIEIEFRRETCPNKNQVWRFASLDFEI